MRKCKHDLNKQVKREASIDSTRIEAEFKNTEFLLRFLRLVFP